MYKLSLVKIFSKQIAIYSLVLMSLFAMILSGIPVLISAQENNGRPEEGSEFSIFDSTSSNINLQGDPAQFPGVTQTQETQGMTGGGQGMTGGGQGMTAGDSAQVGLDESARLENPLSGTVGSIPDLVRTILEIAMMIAIPIVALAIIYSGFLFVSAQGNEEKLKKARQTFFYTIIGGALVLGAVVIANAIAGTIDQLRA